MINPDHFRKLYEYHFSANHHLWVKHIASLTTEQFHRQLPYSLGSVRNQVVHMMNIEERWFSGLNHDEIPGILNPVYFGTQAAVRTRWDGIELYLRNYLVRLDEVEMERPIDDRAAVWQVLFHVLNHGTDHRAQTLASLAQLGVKGFSQDYYLHLLGKF